jgi:nucleoside-diphosphate-sugar epimerase
MLEPATRGTINVLRSCVRAGTVRRVVFTSSVSTLTAVDAVGRRKAVLDESCLRALDDVWRTKPVGWVRALLLASLSLSHTLTSRNDLLRLSVSL